MTWGSAALLVAAWGASMAASDPAAEAGARQLLAASCSGCHQVSGAARTDGMLTPLNTLSRAQINSALHAFRDGTRPATVMDRLARGYNDTQIGWLADQLGTP